jgi:hypothetical protein
MHLRLQLLLRPNAAIIFLLVNLSSVEIVLHLLIPTPPGKIVDACS